MSFLVTAILFGIGIAYVAIQNTAGVTFKLGAYTWRDVPLYIIAVGSLLFGVFISWMLALIDSAFTAFVLQGKNQELKKNERFIGDLRKRIHDLEMENTQLRGIEKQEEIHDEVQEHQYEPLHRPNFFHRLRHGLSLR